MMLKLVNRLMKFWGLFFILALILSACSEPATETRLPPLPTVEVEEPTPLPPTQTSSIVETPVVIPSSKLPVFAVFKEDPAQTEANVNQPVIATDLSNVINPFVLSQAQIDRLGQNGFVVSPGSEKEFFTIYERARYDNLPVFVTSDALLHVYHLMFDKVLRSAERQSFIPLLKQLNQAMLEQVDQQYQALKGSTWEEAALRTAAFIGVGSRLLDPEVQIPSYTTDLVDAEVALVESAGGMLPSPLFPGLEFGEDYSQYIPRGHYTLSDELKAYFKSMMWYGRMTFRLKTNDPEAGRAETRSAILLVHALRHAQINSTPALQAWQNLYSPTVFFVGRSDDLTIIQYGDVIDAVYGTDAELTSLVDETKLDQFIELANQLPPPKILGIVISVFDNVEDVTKGLRFMGQRFVPDAYIFRQLIFRNVGTIENPRGLPKGLDIPATMGSERALELLDQMGETSYENYMPQMEKARAWLTSLTVSEWTETLYNTWLFSFFPLLEVPQQGNPAFMRSIAWVDKQLNTVLGSWAELKHDTILYAKQVYAELGGGPPPPPPAAPKGYVEPVPAFYARLAALTEMTRSGLSERALLGETDSQNLERLVTLVRNLQAIAEKELRSELLSEEDFELIRFIGGELENLTMAAADSDVEDPFAPRFMEEEPQAAIIADVATDPGSGQVLEVAVGRINEIHVVAPIVQPDGQVVLQVCKGGVFSYYEFPWPLTNRLTDEKWREMLESGQAPPLPEWVASFFTSEGEYSQITTAITSFQDSLTQTYWYPLDFVASGESEAMLPVAEEINALNQSRQYLGHQRLGSAVRSVDMQSENKAVITVREEWQDTLYAYSGDYPGYDEAIFKQRGPYTLDTTYTVEFLNGWWQVTGVVYGNQPPEW